MPLCPTSQAASQAVTKLPSLPKLISIDQSPQHATWFSGMRYKVRTVIRFVLHASQPSNPKELYSGFPKIFASIIIVGKPAIIPTEQLPARVATQDEDPYGRRKESRFPCCLTERPTNFASTMTVGNPPVIPPMKEVPDKRGEIQ